MPPLYIHLPSHVEKNKGANTVPLLPALTTLHKHHPHCQHYSCHCYQYINSNNHDNVCTVKDNMQGLLQWHVACEISRLCSLLLHCYCYDANFDLRHMTFAYIDNSNTDIAELLFTNMRVWRCGMGHVLTGL